MSFIAYLAQLRVDGLPHGHFAQHAHEDPSFPEAQTWEELEAHLIGRKADPVTITSAAVCWTNYQTSKNQGFW
jgi:uncharacterized protein YozE (UPF0346 family)